MATSTVENHGSGAQTLHSGRGDQSINTGPGVLLNVDKYVAIHGAEAPIDLVRSLLSQQEIHSSGPVPGNTRSAQSPTTQIISWLKSLSPMDFHDRLSFFLKQMTPGTGEWLLKNEKFLSWKNGKDRILWLDGIIGAGKSILA
ncbi:hypothetical protein N656DRAFT_505280 [Canariomyces notabilis]|uniref:Nephrocystin 3-like N-terminal domain-containing protein n=1 Tax=Canariomyces notabilis TaxID=2074819 RepID=A0AAN6QCG6_9PEZI|nr:hypothetical protein N656DRAFT_505280 [Canariomyces arenarius]